MPAKNNVYNVGLLANLKIVILIVLCIIKGQGKFLALCVTSISKSPF